MLNFIGIGSAFNTKLGNTSAFLKNGNNIILIDCGGQVFSKLKEKKLLDNLEKISIILTHTHSDHIGSLGELIAYSYFMLKIKVRIIYPDKKVIETILNLMGINRDFYNLEDNTEVNLDDALAKKCRIKFLKTSHVNTIPCFAFIMKYQNEKYYYSGDSNIISEEILAMFKNNIIDFIYQDTCGLDYEKNVHLSMSKLEKLIPKELRSRVYCIHYDEYINQETLELLGFNYIHVE